MSDIVVDGSLVGRTVRNATRPEWGDGKVLRVQPLKVEGQPAHRVAIQFTTGHRVVVVPPARLIDPQPEADRETGWLDAIGGRTVDDRLAMLPPSATEVLGTLRERAVALLPLYRYDESPVSLMRWARDQTQIADPLAHWSRDELLIAFRAFCNERDAVLRVALAKLRLSEGPQAISELLATVDVTQRDRITATLRAPI